MIQPLNDYAYLKAFHAYRHFYAAPLEFRVLNHALNAQLISFHEFVTLIRELDRRAQPTGTTMLLPSHTDTGEIHATLATAQ